MVHAPAAVLSVVTGGARTPMTGTPGASPAAEHTAARHQRQGREPSPHLPSRSVRDLPALAAGCRLSRGPRVGDPPRAARVGVVPLHIAQAVSGIPTTAMPHLRPLAAPVETDEPLGSWSASQDAHVHAAEQSETTADSGPAPESWCARAQVLPGPGWSTDAQPEDLFSGDPTRLFTVEPPKSTGKQFEERVARILHDQGLSVLERDCKVAIGPYGTDHEIDWLCCVPGERYWKLAISCKYQGKRGTVEQKLDHEVARLICLLEDNPTIARAHLVIDGPGFSPGLRAWLTGRLREVMPRAIDVDMHFGLDSLRRHRLAVKPLLGRPLPPPTLFDSI